MRDKTLEEEPPGTYEICSICYWEDDEVQFNDHDFEGGANEVSLRQRRKISLRLVLVRNVLLNQLENRLVKI
ncbi:hypothetical protein IG9_03963 [Bacillus cereus HuA2-9]|nr:hypothetical protein IG9_03963 [Bacillus cereus HuA2-9]